MDLEGRDYHLIITIVSKGDAEKALRASQKAGAEGGTIMYGRGVGVHEKRRLLGIPIEPEKEILLTIIPSHLTQAVMGAIREASRLDHPGTGVMFSLRLDQVAGICHMIDGECPA